LLLANKKTSQLNRRRLALVVPFIFTSICHAYYDEWTKNNVKMATYSVFEKAAAAAWELAKALEALNHGNFCSVFIDSLANVCMSALRVGV